MPLQALIGMGATVSTPIQLLPYCYFKAGKLIAVDSINLPADHMLGRKLLAAPNSLTPAQAGDRGFEL